MIKTVNSLVIQCGIRGHWNDIQFVETVEDGLFRIKYLKKDYSKIEFVFLKRRETLEEEVIE